jgi:hypothetical protein
MAIFGGYSLPLPPAIKSGLTTFKTAPSQFGKGAKTSGK